MEYVPIRSGACQGLHILDEASQSVSGVAHPRRGLLGQDQNSNVLTKSGRECPTFSNLEIDHGFRSKNTIFISMRSSG